MPFDALVAVIPTDAGRLLDRLHTLRIHDGRGGAGVPADALAFRGAEGWWQWGEGARPRGCDVRVRWGRVAVSVP